MAYQTLDTYLALFLNEAPAREERVAEIQDRESGDLLCYAEPSKAECIAKAVNHHDELVATVSRLAKIVDAEFPETDGRYDEAVRAFDLLKNSNDLRRTSIRYPHRS